MTAPDDKDERLRSTALQNAASILVARHQAEQRAEAYAAEAQRLSHTGSFGAERASRYDEFLRFVSLRLEFRKRSSLNSWGRLFSPRGRRQLFH